MGVLQVVAGALGPGLSHLEVGVTGFEVAVGELEVVLVQLLPDGIKFAAGLGQL